MGSNPGTRGPFGRRNILRASRAFTMAILVVIR
jgi:hypothetical protein